jgi:hypothetical protein
MPADWVPYIHYVCEVDQPLSISHRPFQCFASAWHAKSLEQRDATQHQSSNRWVECNESVKAVASCARKIYDIGGVVFDEGGRRGGGDLRLRWLRFLASFFFHFLQAIIYVCNSRCLDLKKKKMRIVAPPLTPSLRDNPRLSPGRMGVLAAHTPFSITSSRGCERRSKVN